MTHQFFCIGKKKMWLCLSDRGVQMYKIKELFILNRAYFYVIPAFLWQLLFFYIPFLLMFIMSVICFCPSLKVHLFSWDLYRPFLESTYFLIMIKSVILACVNGILCFLIGYPLALFIAFKAGRWKTAFLFLLILPFWTNFLLHVYAWFFVLDHQGIVNYLLRSLNVINQPISFLIHCLA